MLKAINNRAQKLVDTSFLVTYLVKFIVLYYGCKYFFLAWWGISDPKGSIYSAFCEQYLNFNLVVKAYMFQAPIFITQLFGVQAFQASADTLQVENGGQLMVKWPCYGMGLLSFWVAFVLADSTGWKQKFIWCIVGVASLLTINIMRVCLMLIAKQNQWNIHFLDSYGLDHHTQFNIVAYLLIFLMMFIYYQRNKGSLGKEGDPVVAAT
jgi:exosortase/archaeosortase family protein